MLSLQYFCPLFAEASVLAPTACTEANCLWGGDSSCCLLSSLLNKYSPSSPLHISWWRRGAEASGGQILCQRFTAIDSHGLETMPLPAYQDENPDEVCALPLGNGTPNSGSVSTTLLVMGSLSNSRLAFKFVCFLICEKESQALFSMEITGAIWLIWFVPSLQKKQLFSNEDELKALRSPTVKIWRKIIRFSVNTDPQWLVLSNGTPNSGIIKYTSAFECCQGVCSAKTHVCRTPARSASYFFLSQRGASLNCHGVCMNTQTSLLLRRFYCQPYLST